MLLRRLTTHIKDQSWVAIVLDLVVVIVGIFIAFQVDRWYETKRLESEEEGYLIALAEDFAASREDIERVIGRHSRATDAVFVLLAYDKGGPVEISNDDFYSLLADVQLTGTFDPTRYAYDLLIATGDIESIRDDRLKSEMAAFFAGVEGSVSSIRDRCFNAPRPPGSNGRSQADPLCG